MDQYKLSLFFTSNATLSFYGITVFMVLLLKVDFLIYLFPIGGSAALGTALLHFALNSYDPVHVSLRLCSRLWKASRCCEQHGSEWHSFKLPHATLGQ